MFVVFEGIDGSGKTTLSNRVAQALRAGGLAVEHVREGGTFASAVTQAMRELGRDARNLALTPRAELMLYLTREVQLLDEVTRTARARTDVVIADRYVYTAEALAIAGRGLDPDEVAPLVAAAANGVLPDLVVLVDVDPHVARARRRSSKLIAGHQRPPSRKGLTGTDLQRRLRQAYLGFAAREPARWVVVDNTDADLETMTTSLVEVIVGRRQGHAVSPRPSASTIRSATSPAEARDALLGWIEQRARREPATAAYMLADLAGDGFDGPRRALAAEAPQVIAAGLRELDDPVSWELRRTLWQTAPEPVARSIVGLAAARPEATEMLTNLSGVVPQHVGLALRRRDDDDAWTIRSRLPDDAALVSVAGLATERAWAIRDRWLARHGEVVTVEAATLVCMSVSGVGDPRAWDLRRACRELAPVAALASTFGLVDERAWKWRARHFEHAPKTVMHAIEGLDDDRAWTLRAAVAERCEEVLSSIAGLDSERAWTLRDRQVAVWPWRAISSLGPLATTGRGRALIGTAMEHAPTSIAVWRHAVIATAGDRAW